MQQDIVRMSSSGMIFSLLCWGLLAVTYLVNPTLAQTLGAILAGLLLASGFTWIGWANVQETVSEPLVALKLLAARQAGLVSAGLGAAAFLTAGLLGGGSVYGMMPGAGPLTSLVFIGLGLVVGGFMYFGLEIDEGFRQQDIANIVFSFSFTASLWLLLLLLGASGGGAVLFLSLIGGRVALSGTLYRWRPQTLNHVESWTPDLLVALIMIVPVSAFIFSLG